MPPFLKLYSYELKAPLGGKGIRTPDIQLAKLALYQLSYAPGKIIFARNRLLRGQGTKTELWVIRPQVVALSRGHGVFETNFVSIVAIDLNVWS